MPRFLTAPTASLVATSARVRWALLLIVLLGSAATGPVRPTTSVGAAVWRAEAGLATAWRDVLALGCSTAEVD